MSKRPTNGSVPAFGNFLAYLRLQGFRIGLDHYVRLQELFKRIGTNRDPDELRTLLCPLFATSKKQQERFYEAFDSYAELVQISPPQPTPREPDKTKGPESKKQTPRQWLYLAGAGSLLTVVLIGLALGVIPTPSFLKGAPQPSPEVTPKPDTTPTATPSSSPTATVLGGSRTVPLRVTPQPTNTPRADISREEVKPPVIKSPPPARFYLVVISGLFAIFLLWELYRLIRRKLFLRRQSARRPPSIWPIRVEAPAVKLYDSEDFYRAARLMRRRQVAEYHRLDVPATVAATITARGYPSFRYKPDSKAPEYLVLIDRASFRDHQAQLFNELIRAFEREGLFVVRYFYEGDPRVCCDDKGENCIHLSELQNQYVGYRLLIFGNGDKLLDPITGRLAAWTSMFLDWQDRAVLTPEARWELREFSLSSQFVVLPATLDGLMALVDHFDTMVTTDPRIWSPVGLQIPPADLDENTSVEVLNNYLGEQAFQWLCACAVYPELQWNLTLFLGSLGCMSPTTVREQNLLRLIRLPWFRNGSLPDAVRWPLINQLGETREREVRASIIHLLEKSPAPAGTLASDKYDLELAVQHWRLEQDDESLNELRRVMGRLTPGQILKDQTLVHYLERMPNPVLDLLLPRRLRKYFFRSGILWFGLKTGVRFGITLLLIGLASVLIRNQTIPVPQFLKDAVVSPSASPTTTASPSPGSSPSPSLGPSPPVSPGPTPAISPRPRPAISPRPRRLVIPDPRVSDTRADPTGTDIVGNPAPAFIRPGRPTLPRNPGETTPGEDNSEISLFVSRGGPRYTRKFQNPACPIEKVEVQRTLDESRITGVSFRIRSGVETLPLFFSSLPESAWATALTDTCATIAKTVGVDPNPTPTPSPTVLMPNLVGLTEAEMRKKLAASRLKLGKLTYEPFGSPGLVISQYPSDIARISEGAAVNVVVSRASEDDSNLVTVPNVVGMDAPRAVRTIQSARLTYQIIYDASRSGLSFTDSFLLFKQARFEYAGGSGVKKVVRQDPRGGTKVPEGARVRLWVR